MTEKHVLIVDDDPLILEVLARALAGQDIRITTARRVSVARATLMCQPVDLVIADVRMPGESGVQLAKAAADLGIATILMSGDREWALQHDLGPERYLAKPFDLQRLRRLVALRLAHGGDGVDA